MSEEQNCSINTNKTIWKQPTTDYGKEDGNDEGMEPSIFVTKEGAVGFNHYGTCYVKTIKEWVTMAKQESMLMAIEKANDERNP